MNQGIDEGGSPVVDLTGRTIGINIAVADRVSTLAIPVTSILPVLEELKSGKYAPADIGTDVSVIRQREAIDWNDLDNNFENIAFNRYKKILFPSLPNKGIITLQEGNTPLYDISHVFPTPSKDIIPIKDAMVGITYDETEVKYLTEKWKIGFRSGYDFVNKDFTYTSIDIYRDLHCWEMNFNWIPFGFLQSYNFSIKVKSAVLQDLKLTRKREWFDNNFQ